MKRTRNVTRYKETRKRPRNWRSKRKRRKDTEVDSEKEMEDYEEEKRIMSRNFLLDEEHLEAGKGGSDRIECRRKKS